MTWPERPTQTAETPQVLRELAADVHFLQRNPLAPQPDIRDIGRRTPYER